MSQEHEQEQAHSDSPQFIPSPEPTRSGPPPEASAYGDQPVGQAPNRTDDRSTDGSDHSQDAKGRDSKVDEAKAKKPDEASKPKPDDAQDPNATPKKTSTASLLSSSILMIVGAAIAAGTYALARAFAPPTPPGETAGPPADMAKKEDLKKLSDRLDEMTAELTTAKKQIADRPDYSPELKMQRSRVDALDRSIATIPAQIDSINQKLATVTKIEDSSAAGRVDALDKRVSDLAQTVEDFKNSPSSALNSAPMPATEIKVDQLAMQGAIDLYKAKQWSEAMSAFTKLQSLYPNDATVWYYSALCNGFSTGKWLGETERLVNVGLAKEKAGQPSSSTIDAAFQNLTKETGKDWLAGYRKRVGN